LGHVIKSKKKYQTRVNLREQKEVGPTRHEQGASIPSKSMMHIVLPPRFFNFAPILANL